MWKNLGVAAVVAGVIWLLGGSCGSASKNACVDRNVRCSAPLICDPGDGICKCGGRGGVKCGEGWYCDPVANTCLSSKCAHPDGGTAVDCSDKPGTSCDVLTGRCACGGTGGAECAATEVCNPNAKACVSRSNCNQVACSLNQVCDSASGQCRCGAAVCAPGQACTVDGNSQKSCVADNCFGVVCTGGTTCDSSDGLCKCSGVVCLSGQACTCSTSSDAGCPASQRVCRTSGLCNSVVCANSHTGCDPADGQCKCGGPGGPICSSNQICNLGPPPRCEGGEQCTLSDGGPRLCTGGTSCDPEDGLCKCGGRGGVVCAPAAAVDGGGMIPAEICISNPIQLACRRPCDVRNLDCQAGTYCYFDSSASVAAAYCAVPTDTKDEDSACTTPTACFSMARGAHSLHCLGLALGQTGICRAYCDTAAGISGCLQDRPRTCLPIPTAPTGTGYCNPL